MNPHPRFMPHKPDRNKPTGRVAVIGLIAALTSLVLLNACASNDRLNVYLITIDTLRADHLACYGYGAIQTPNIDRLASLGTLYENAFTVVPVTLPSHLSIMTGTYPSFHGVRENAGFYAPEEIETLAEVLGDRGYDTGAVVGAFPLDSQTGIDQGFDFYDDNFSSSKDGRHPLLRAYYDERKAADVARSAMAWLDDRGKRPFFLWTHFFDPHHPLNPPSPFRERYHDAPYDGEIASVDAAIGQILARLEERGLSDNTLVVLTADHGEGLGEHGERTHALLLYSSTLRVPLIVKDPRDTIERRVTNQVATLDIFATILERLNIKVPEANQGIPLPNSDAEADPDREILSETLFGRMVYGWSPLKRITNGDQTVIFGPTSRLYDRLSDRGELTDLADTSEDEMNRLMGHLRRLEDQWSEGGFKTNRNQPSDETRERLAALGYVGSGFSSSDELDDRIDPNRLNPLENMEIFELHNEARNLSEAQRHDLAIPLLERAQNLDPENPAVLLALAQSLIAIGDQRGPLTLEDLIKVAPDQVTTYIMLAGFHRNIGQLSEAITLLEGAIEIDPANLSTRLQLAHILEDAGRLDASESVYREILEREASHVLAANGLATLRFRRGDAESALTLLDGVLRNQPYFAPAFLNKAIIEYDRGNTATAVELAEHALVLSPNYARAVELLKLMQRDSAETRE